MTAVIAILLATWAVSFFESRAQVMGTQRTTDNFAPYPYPLSFLATHNTHEVMALDETSPMDIDEETLPTGNTSLKENTAMDADSLPPAAYSTEEEARQAIEMMKGDVLTNRTAAASRLDFVAKALGDIRTREVRVEEYSTRVALFHFEIVSS